MTSSSLQEIVETFASVDEETRLELLLDYAARLPALPPRLQPQREAGLHRVPECMSPVFLWVEREGGHIRLFVDVAEEAPTVRGILSIIVGAYDRQPVGDVAQLPHDLLHRLKLTGLIRMNRAVGLNAIIGRVRREAQALHDEAATLHDRS